MIFNENQVTFSKLAELFDSAYFDFKQNDDEFIINENDIKVLVRIDEKKKHILIYGLMTFAGRDMDHMLKVVNKMNEDLILVRFYLSEPHADGITLIGDYSLSYDGGLVDRHLMNSIKLFSRVFAHSREMGF